MRLIHPFCLLVAILPLFTKSVDAAVRTWDGGSATTSNWTDAVNWTSDTAPSANDSLVFDGSARTSNNDDFAAGTNFAGITIASTAASMTLGGNSINLSGNIAMNRPTTSTINNAFVLQQNVAIDVPNSSATLTLGGAFSGGFKVTKTGAGLAVYNVANSYTGGNDITGGTLRTGVAGNTTASLGTGTISISNSATLDLRSTSAVTLNNDLAVGSGGGNISFRASHTFSPVTLTGSGPLGMTAGATGQTTTPTDFKGWNGQINAFTPASQTYTVRLANAFVTNSMINAGLDLGAGVTLTKQNGTNVTITIDIGKLSGAAGSSMGGSTAGSGTFVYSVGARNEDSTYNGTIADGGTKTGIRKVGSAGLTLTGANTYSGATTIDAGALVANNSSGSATGSSAVTVNNTGTLAGTGSVSGVVSVNGGGTLSPGQSIDSLGTGTLNFNADATSGATLKFEIGPSGTADLVNAALGALNLVDPTSSFGATLALSSSGYVPTGNKYTVIAYNGTWNSNSFKNAPNNGYVFMGGANPRQFLIRYQDQNPGGNFFTTETQPGSPNINANTRFVTLVAVPELSSILAAGMVVICVVGSVILGRRLGFNLLRI